MRPTHYIEAEGGEWRPWEGPELDAGLLEERRSRRAQGQRVVWIFDIPVHALKFQNGRVWDVVNSWRKHGAV